MFRDKTVVDAFNTTWEQSIMASACDNNTEIFPDQRVVIVTSKLGGGEFAAIYGDSDYPKVITTRWGFRGMLLPMMVHHLWQEVFRLPQNGIRSEVFYQDGVCTCVYTRGGEST